MPSTHLSLNFHIVFSTKERRTCIDPAWISRLHAYFGGTVRSLDAVPREVGGVSDHVHLLVGLKATHRLADVMRDIKRQSSLWIHETIGLRSFAWQEGYGAFAVSSKELASVRRYIQRQPEHHRSKTFQEEYRELIEMAGIEYDERYLW